LEGHGSYGIEVKIIPDSPESFNGGIHEAAADSQPETSVDNVVASLEWLDEKMGTANLDLVPENLEKVCLETWEKERWITITLPKTHSLFFASFSQCRRFGLPFPSKPSGVNSL